MQLQIKLNNIGHFSTKKTDLKQTYQCEAVCGSLLLCTTNVLCHTCFNLLSVFWFSAKELYYMLVLARCSFLGKDLSSAEKTQVE